jgi:peptidoglycan/LPS O-acetylase OafA/YrhL
MKKILVIDLVRAFSILSVLAAHLGPQYITRGTEGGFLQEVWFKLWVNGQYGVSVFFVVSGFLITQTIASNPKGLYQPDFRDFYVRRAGRILPLLAVCCLTGFVIMNFFKTPSPRYDLCFRGGPDSYPAAFWVSIAIFSMNWYALLHKDPSFSIGLYWGILWSLSIEEQFYLLYPMVLRAVGRERNLVFFLAAVVLAGPLSMVVGLGHQLGPLFFKVKLNSFAGFNQIAMGCLLYLASHRYKPYLEKNKRVRLYLMFSGLAVCLLTYSEYIVRIDYWWEVFGCALIGLGISMFLLGALHSEFFKSPFWAIPGLLGKLSYGGYLYHVSVLFFIWPLLTGKNDYVGLAILTAATFGISYLSFYLYEKPVNLFIRRVFGRSGG